nr:hypothetical protein [Tanacetum cinerariifolium]
MYFSLVPLALALQVLRRLGSIFTLVYAVFIDGFPSLFFSIKTILYYLSPFSQLFVSASFFPSAGDVVALSAKGTPLVVAPDAFSTRVGNLFKDERLEIVEVKVSSFDEISFRSLSSLISMSLICCFSSLISPNNPMIFEGSSCSSVGKQLAKSCEAQSLDSSSFKEVTRSSVSWLMSSYEGVTKGDLVSFKICAKSSSFTFHEMSLAHDSLFALEVVWGVFKPSLVDMVLSTRTLGLYHTRSASAVKSAKALCPYADLKFKMKEVDQTDVGPPVACYATLCISPTTSMRGEGWLGLVSMAKLDLVSFFERPDRDLDASVVDSDVCFEDCFLLSKKGFGLLGLSRVTGSSLGVMSGDDDSTNFNS